MWFVDVCIRMLGIVRVEKTNRRHKELRTLRVDPDVESDLKELIMLSWTIPYFQRQRFDAGLTADGLLNCVRWKE